MPLTSVRYPEDRGAERLDQTGFPKDSIGQGTRVGGAVTLGARGTRGCEYRAAQPGDAVADDAALKTTFEDAAEAAWTLASTNFS